MPFVELAPPVKDNDRISISQHKKSGKLTVALSSVVALRNKISGDSRLRVAVDMEASPRVMRLTLDLKGPFKAVKKIKNSVTISLPKIAHMPPLEERVYVEFDEDKLDDLHYIDIELPALWQAKTLQVAPVVRRDERPTFDGTAGRSNNGGNKGRF